MANVLELPPLDMTRRQGQAGVFALQRLHAGQLVGAHDVLSRRGTGRGVMVECTDPGHLRVELLIGGRRQPVADPMRLEVPLLSSRAAWRGESVALGTNTDPYQWVEGRYKLMRGIWEAMRDAANPCSILTKSPLLLRDLDLMKEIADRTGENVGNVRHHYYRGLSRLRAVVMEPAKTKLSLIGQEQADAEA